MADRALDVALFPLGEVAKRAITVRDGIATDPESKRGATQLIRSLQLARLALEFVSKMPGGIEELERERAERYGDSHERP